MSASQHLIVIHCVRDIDESSGGPARSVPAFAAAQAEHDGVKSLLMARNSPSPLLPPSDSGLQIDLKEEGLFQRFRRNGFAAKEPGRAVLHVHGLWVPDVQRTAAWAANQSIPFVVSPRGMLEEAALQTKWLKKRIGWYLYQRRVLQRARVIHATSSSEVESIRRQGIRTPVLLAPNGVDIDRFSPREPADGLGHEKRVVFLGRLHAIKNLPALLRAWSSVRGQGWRLVLAGPDEAGISRELLRLARELGVEEVIDLPGAVSENDKAAFLRQADCVVLPSLSENFGMVVVEALASGVPVIASSGTPWKDVENQGCGWSVEPTIAGLAEALREAMTLSDARRTEMGQRGRSYVEREFRWGAVAERLVDAYRWVLGHGDAPVGLIR